MRTGYADGLDRDGGDHYAIHDAGVSIPADRVAAHARQHRTGVHPRRRPERRADSADAGRRSWTRRVCRRSRVGLGLRPAVEHVASARAHARASPIEVAYTGSKITRVGLPDTNLNQLTVDQLAEGAALLQRVPNPYFGSIPRSSSLGDPTIPRAPAPQAVSAVHHSQSLQEQRRHDRLSRRLHEAGTALLATACRISSATRAPS